MLPVHRQLEQLLWQVAAARYGSLLSRRKELQLAIQLLSQRYNQPAPSFLTPRGAEPYVGLARLVFFTMADLPKVAYPLGELLSRDQLPPGPLRVLDVGAGYGSMTLGLIAWLHSGQAAVPLHIEALDTDPAGLAILDQVIAALRASHTYPAGLSVQVAQQDLTQDLSLKEGYSLILVGSVLNELPAERQAPLVQALLEHLAPRGHLILVEPALKRTARALHHLRDGLIASGQAHVFAPCTHQEPCPALVDPGDWCHECRTWSPPPEFQKLARHTGLRRRHLKWSYLTVNRHGKNLATAQGPFTWRVVSDPLPAKGKQELFFCGSSGRQRIALLKRHRTPANAAFWQLQRGYLAWLDNAAMTATSSAVRTLDPASRVRIEDPTWCRDPRGP